MGTSDIQPLHDTFPMVSVVMTAYNEQEHIRTSISAIQEQSYDNWELVIVDDGSCDGTLDVVRSMATRDSRLRVYRSSHGGRAQALNIALAHTQGDYVAICDADDIAVPARLTLQVSLLQRRPDIAIVGGGVLFVDEQLRPLRQWQPPSSSFLVRMYAIVGMPTPHTTIMFRREVLDVVVGYREAPFKDYDFVVRVLKHFAGCNIHRKLSRVVVHSNSVMSSLSFGSAVGKSVRARFLSIRVLARPLLLPVQILLGVTAVSLHVIRLLSREFFR
jgi:glycosyltransferase involved in cell wall biosynthesis